MPSGLALFLRSLRIPLVARRRRSRWLALGSALLMVGVTVATCFAFNFNPREAYYLPLLPPVLVSAVLFGFGASLFAVIASIVAADFFFAPPEFDFAIAQWEDVLGLATFGIIGSLAAMVIDEFLSFPD
jgi:K+-sensing histidine kinase KdpD